MKELSTIGLDVLEKLTKDAGEKESERLGVLLKSVPDKELALDIDFAIGAYVNALRKAGFLAGLEVGQNLLGVLVEERK